MNKTVETSQSPQRGTEASLPFALVHKLTLLQRRIWNVMVVTAHTQRAEGRTEFVMPLQQLIRETDLRGGNIDAVKEFLGCLRVSLRENEGGELCLMWS